MINSYLSRLEYQHYIIGEKISFPSFYEDTFFYFAEVLINLSSCNATRPIQHNLERQNGHVNLFVLHIKFNHIIWKF